MPTKNYPGRGKFSRMRFKKREEKIKAEKETAQKEAQAASKRRLQTEMAALKESGLSGTQARMARAKLRASIKSEKERKKGKGFQSGRNSSRDSGDRDHRELIARVLKFKEGGSSSSKKKKQGSRREASDSKRQAEAQEKGLPGPVTKASGSASRRYFSHSDALTAGNSFSPLEAQDPESLPEKGLLSWVLDRSGQHSGHAATESSGRIMEDLEESLETKPALGDGARVVCCSGPSFGIGSSSAPHRESFADSNLPATVGGSIRGKEGTTAVPCGKDCAAVGDKSSKKKGKQKKQSLEKHKEGSEEPPLESSQRKQRLRKSKKAQGDGDEAVVLSQAERNEGTPLSVEAPRMKEDGTGRKKEGADRKKDGAARKINGVALQEGFQSDEETPGKEKKRKRKNVEDVLKGKESGRRKKTKEEQKSPAAHETLVPPITKVGGTENARESQELTKKKKKKSKKEGDHMVAVAAAAGAEGLDPSHLVDRARTMNLEPRVQLKQQPGPETLLSQGTLSQGLKSQQLQKKKLQSQGLQIQGLQKHVLADPNEVRPVVTGQEAKDDDTSDSEDDAEEKARQAAAAAVAVDCATIMEGAGPTNKRKARRGRKSTEGAKERSKRKRSGEAESDEDKDDSADSGDEAGDATDVRGQRGLKLKYFQIRAQDLLHRHLDKVLEVADVDNKSKDAAALKEAAEEASTEDAPKKKKKKSKNSEGFSHTGSNVQSQRVLQGSEPCLGVSLVRGGAIIATK